MVKKKRLLFFSIVECNAETAAYGNQELFALFVCMSAAAFSCRYVIYPVSAFDAERNVVFTFCYSKVASWVDYFGRSIILFIA